MSNILTPGLMPDSLAGIQAAFNAGDASSKAAFQAAVSGDRAALNTQQQAQQAAGATTALLSADKSSLLDPGGGPAINIRRYKVVGTLTEVLAVTGSYGDDALATDLGNNGCRLTWSGAASAWKVDGPQTLLAMRTQIIGDASTAEQILSQLWLAPRNCADRVFHKPRLPPRKPIAGGCVQIAATLKN